MFIPFAKFLTRVTGVKVVDLDSAIVNLKAARDEVIAAKEQLELNISDCEIAKLDIDKERCDIVSATNEKAAQLNKIENEAIEDFEKQIDEADEWLAMFLPNDEFSGTINAESASEE